MRGGDGAASMPLIPHGDAASESPATSSLVPSATDVDGLPDPVIERVDSVYEVTGVLAGSEMSEDESYCTTSFAAAPAMTASTCPRAVHRTPCAPRGPHPHLAPSFAAGTAPLPAGTLADFAAAAAGCAVFGAIAFVFVLLYTRTRWGRQGGIAGCAAQVAVLTGYCVVRFAAAAANGCDGAPACEDDACTPAHDCLAGWLMRVLILVVYSFVLVCLWCHRPVPAGKDEIIVNEVEDPLIEN